MGVEPVFKVLVNGKSCHGGTLEWSLPKKNRMGIWRPGSWHEVEGPLSICSHGLHLTTKPEEWYKDGCVVYVAEFRGESKSGDRQKLCVRAARLREPVKVPTWVFSGSGSGYGDGYGYGYGYGSGYGYGYGSGYGDGYGDGNGNGDGDGSGYGDGYGDGDGDGNGDGDGDGSNCEDIIKQ